MAKEYIEREAALKAVDARIEQLKRDAVFAKKGMSGVIDVGGVKNHLLSIPAADVAPVVRGQWIDKNAGNATCSVCKRRHKNVYDDDASDLFCRSCGAKMEVQDD